METSNSRALNIRRPGSMGMEEEMILPPELMQPGMEAQIQMDPSMMDPRGMQPSMDDVAGRVFTPGVGWKKLPTS
jgi:hypothetical protein